MSVRRLVGLERSDLAEFLQTLTTEEWEAPSLCTGWRIRDVVAHLFYDTMSVPSYALEVVRAGLSTDRMNQRSVRRGAECDPTELVDALGRLETRGLIAALAPRIALPT